MKKEKETKTYPESRVPERLSVADFIDKYRERKMKEDYDTAEVIQGEIDEYSYREGYNAALWWVDSLLCKGFVKSGLEKAREILNALPDDGWRNQLPPLPTFEELKQMEKEGGEL